MTKMWDTVKLGDLELKNRLVMAPMTRSRALPNGVPGEYAAKYYSQRASMGLIITEGTQPSEVGQGYTLTPGIYTDDQVKGWRKVTDAAHDAGSHIFIQLMHVGRTSHPDNLPNHNQAVAPSAIAPGESIFTPTGMQPVPTPKEMTQDDIKQTIADFVNAAKRAIEAGADGVEIHGANGYLLHQFLGENSNHRTDKYGGSIENRARFSIEVATAVADAIGPEHTGFRISPLNHLGKVDEGSDAPALYDYLTKELDKLNLAYLHMMHVGYEDILKDVRNNWHQDLIVNRPSRPIEDIDKDITDGMADLVSIGGWSLTNPDFPKRLKEHAPLNDPHKETFYGGEGENGYTDYPFLKQRV